jgi:hypothetical protein
MAELTGSEILAKALKKEGTDEPLLPDGRARCCSRSPRASRKASADRRAARAVGALMGQAYSRLLQKPSVCMAASGPGVINLTTGMANALIDCCPVVAIGGSSPIQQFGRQVFQEIDQVAIMRGCVKWADRVYNLKRIPGAGQHRVPARDERQAGPDVPRFPGRRAVREDRRERGRLVDERPADPECAPARRPGAGRRADPGAEPREEAGDHLGQRRDLVAGRGRDAAARRARRDSVLHHAAGPRRRARTITRFRS